MAKGPFLLTTYGIQREVPRRTAGAYALGSLRMDADFGRADFLGRADADLVHELSGHIGHFQTFLFVAAPTAEEAFHRECEIYHQLNRPDLRHPTRPAGSDWVCPICGRVGDEDSPPRQDQTQDRSPRPDTLR